MTENKEPLIILQLISIALVLIALFPLPYGYYIFLRIAMFISMGILAYYQWTQKQSIDIWVAILVGFAILYNPIIPVHLTREIWSVLNILTAAGVGLHMIFGRKEQNE